MHNLGSTLKWSSYRLVRNGQAKTRTADARKRLDAVQALRALAAMLVVTGHAIYEARVYDATGTLAHIANWPVWSAGVDLFFVLSGYIMMWTFGERFAEPHAPREFLARRLVRILPPYWAFTLLLAVAIVLVPGRIETARLDTGHLALSLLLIPHVAPTGGIHPLLALGWTLMYEMFFYLAFAVALLFPRRIGLALLVVAFTVSNLAARSGVPMPDALALMWGDTVIFEFLLGIAFYFIQRDGGLATGRMIAVVAALLAATSAARLMPHVESRFLLYGLPALAILALASWAVPLRRSALVGLLVLVGDASYTLYLSHPFVLEPVKELAEIAGGSWFGIALYLVAAVTCAIAFALIFYRLIERRLSRRLGQAMGIRPRSAFAGPMTP